MSRNALVIEREDYVAEPTALVTNVRSFLDMVAAEMKTVSKHAQAGTTPAITYMDKFYKSWTQTKKKGKYYKKRHLCAATNDSLKYLHDYIQRVFHLPSSKDVFSYKAGKSSTDCAMRHTKKFALYKLDITDFFPSITREMIQEMYEEYFEWLWDKVGSKSSVRKKYNLTKGELLLAAREIAILCTRSDTRGINTNDAVLPIGIEPASTISNHVLKSLDTTLSRMSKAKNITYSRYSDNMFFSSNYGDHIPKDLQEAFKKKVEEYEFAGVRAFKINERKTKYLARWRQQRMLGIVVNEKTNLPKGKERYLRSALNHAYHDMYQIYSTIISRKCRFDTAETSVGQMHRRIQKIFGQLSYVYSIAPDKYLKYSTAQQAVRWLLDESNVEMNNWAVSRAKKSGGSK